MKLKEVNLIVVTSEVRDVPTLVTINTAAIAITDSKAGIDCLAMCFRRCPRTCGRCIAVVGIADWAQPIARKLRKVGVHDVYWCQPPALPDCRSWVLARLHMIEDESDLRHLGDKLWVRLNGMANDPDDEATGPPPEIVKPQALPLSGPVLNVLLADGSWQLPRDTLR